ncbi:hypothetical protein V2G26_000954 [Clonostachys chloroleuca]
MVSHLDQCPLPLIVIVAFLDGRGAGESGGARFCNLECLRAQTTSRTIGMNNNKRASVHHARAATMMMLTPNPVEMDGWGGKSENELTESTRGDDGLFAGC